MTHDELLETIDNRASYWHRKPLRAVVELHKSKETTYQKMLGKWASDSPVLSCEYCGGYYPCPTIQVIEKELE